MAGCNGRMPRPGVTSKSRPAGNAPLTIRGQAPPLSSVDETFAPDRSGAACREVECHGDQQRAPTASRWRRVRAVTAPCSRLARAPGLATQALRTQGRTGALRDSPVCLAREHGGRSARDAGVNLMSDDGINYAKARVEALGPIGGLAEEDRLWRNMLSSQPLAFSIAGELRRHADAAAALFSRFPPARRSRPWSPSSRPRLPGLRAARDRGRVVSAPQVPHSGPVRVRHRCTGAARGRPAHAGHHRGQVHRQLQLQEA